MQSGCSSRPWPKKMLSVTTSRPKGKIAAAKDAAARFTRTWHNADVLVESSAF